MKKEIITNIKKTMDDLDSASGMLNHYYEMLSYTANGLEDDLSHNIDGVMCKLYLENEARPQSKIISNSVLCMQEYLEEIDTAIKTLFDEIKRLEKA